MNRPDEFRHSVDCGTQYRGCAPSCRYQEWQPQPRKRRKLFGAHLARPVVKSLDVLQPSDALAQINIEGLLTQLREIAQGLRGIKPWPHSISP